MKKILLFLLVSAISCSNNDNVKPTELVFGFKSYSSFQSIKNDLKARNLTYTILENSSLPKGDNRPRFDITEIRVLGLSDEFKDGVFFSFYNDQLMRVWVYVKELNNAKSIQRYLAKYNITLENNLKEKINSDIQVTVNLTNENSFIISFEETNLSAERWDWVKKYS